MNHAYVEENAVVDLYLAGRLDGPDEAAFEEHYLSCARCLEELETAEAFRAGLKRVAAEDAVKAAVVRRVGLAAWIARAGRGAGAGLLAAALIAILLPSGLLYRQLGRERGRSAELGAELAAARQPRGALYLSLSPERGAAGQEPSARVRLPAEPGPIVVGLELDRPRHEAYRVTLVDPDGEAVWHSAALAPNHLDTLTVSLPSDFLRPGDYGLAVEGLPAAGAPVAAARFAIRFTAAAP